TVAEEDRAVTQVAAQAEVLLVIEHDRDRIDAHRLPQRALGVAGRLGLRLRFGLGDRGLGASRSFRARSTSARSTSGVVMTSWMASSTSSQPLATVFRMDFHSLSPSRL